MGIDYSKLLKVDDPEAFKRYVLLTFKKRNHIEEIKHQRLKIKYKPFGNEYIYLLDEYIRCGRMTSVIEKIDEKRSINRHTLTKKGLAAIKWRKIDYFKPEWLSENKKFWIPTIISVFAVIVSIGTLLIAFKTIFKTP